MVVSGFDVRVKTIENGDEIGLVWGSRRLVGWLFGTVVRERLLRYRVDVTDYCKQGRSRREDGQSLGGG